MGDARDLAEGGDTMSEVRKEKMEAFVAHVLEECEQEGFTVEEVLRIPQRLRFAVHDRMEEIRKETKFSAPQADK